MTTLTLSANPSSLVLNINKLQLSVENRQKLNQLLEEFTFIDAIAQYNIPIDNKILLYGATGCGKTATANAIAKQLNKKIITLHLGNFVSSRLGETAKNITNTFTSARIEKAILFIDEFDFIGKTRDYDQKDSGEMKRLVNVLLQQIDNLDKNTLLICATNHIEAIDSALLRRFQLKLEYNLPTQKELDIYYDNLLIPFPKSLINFERKFGFSYAEAKDYVFQKIKNNIISMEKQKKQLLFSYGTLQLENVQIETYGRKLKEKNDTLSGYRLEELQIKDTSVIEKSAKEIHPIAIKSNSNEETIDGKIFEITMDELIQTDLYEVNDYKRVLETFKSGIKAWVYVKK